MVKRIIIFFVWAVWLVAVRVPAAENKSVVLTPAQLQYLDAVLRLRIKHDGLPESDRKMAAEVLNRVDGAAPEKIPSKRPSASELREMLKDELRGRVAEDPDKRSCRLDLAAFYLFSHEPQLASRHMQMAGPGSQQDIFWPLMNAHADLLLGEYGKGVASLEKTFEAASRLVPLRIDRAVLCEHIRQHGQYTPRKSGALKPGESTWVYIEVVGGVFSDIPDVGLKLSFKFDIELRNEMQNTLADIKNYCVIAPVYQHRVREVFAGMDFVLPKDLAAGEYTLIITCRDENSGKVATRDIVFTVDK